MGELGVISVNSGTFVFLRRQGGALQTQHTQGGDWCKGLGPRLLKAAGVSHPRAPVGYF
jgi:hypothetical protein